MFFVCGHSHGANASKSTSRHQNDVNEAPQYTTVQTHAFERTIADVKRDELKFYALDLRKGTFWW